MHKLLLIGFVYLAFSVPPVAAQTAPQPAAFNELLQQYLSTGLSTQPLQDRKRVGSLSANPYLPGSTSSLGSRYSPDSPKNPYGQYGSPYSPDGAANPYALGGLEVYGKNGTYLGRLNGNRYDPESISNPYGRYGSRYSPESVNNPYGQYGSPYSPYSAKNPYATQPPSLYTP